MTALKRVPPLFTKPLDFPLDPADALKTFRQWARLATSGEDTAGVPRRGIAPSSDAIDRARAKILKWAKEATTFIDTGDAAITGHHRRAHDCDPDADFGRLVIVRRPCGVLP